MKVFSFIKWWWLQLELGTRFALPIISWFVLIMISMLANMPYVALALASVAPIATLLFLVAIVYNYWEKYNNHLDKERQGIVDKLAGKSPRR